MMKLKIDKKDVVIMVVMTVVYFLVALVNLGSIKVPQKGYTLSNLGEKFYVKFDNKHYINKISYYCGLGADRDVRTTIKVEYKDESGRFRQVTSNGKRCYIRKKTADVFKLLNINFDPVSTDKLRFKVMEVGGKINKIAIYEVGNEEPIKDFKVLSQNKDMDKLFDKQSSMPSKATYKNSAYFDEIYHARTAYEHIHKIKQYENTHPPLGKVIIALGIKIFGMTPFGWRIMGMLFGTMMIPIMYLFGMKVFGRKLYAFSCAFLMMFDFMHFTQTRISTIDVFVTFFVILMYYYMYDVYMNYSFDNPKLYYRSFALAGIMWGIGIATKWIAAYASVGLFLLFLASKYREYRKLKNKRLIKKDIKKVLIYGITFFIIIPIAIYVCSYIPVLGGEPKGAELFDVVIKYAKHMYNYHSKSVLGSTHPFSSKWYEWPIMKRPMWYYVNNDLPKNLRSTIVALGNPFVWWVSIVAFAFTIVSSIKRRDRRMVPIIVATLCQYIPWMFVERITFIYHFFSIVPFGIIMIVYMFERVIKDSQKRRNILYVYLGLVLAAFVVFYPAISGMVVSKQYIEKIRWFKTWVF